MKKEFETPVLRCRVFSKEILLTESTKNNLNIWLENKGVQVQISKPNTASSNG